MFEFSPNSDAAAFGLDIGFPFGARHEWRTSKIDLGGSPVAVVHGLHGSRYADIYQRRRLRIPSAFALLRNGVRGMHAKQAQGRGRSEEHTSELQSLID